MAVLAALGAGAFAVVFMKARGGDGEPRNTSRPAADASVRSAAPDAPTVPAVPDASPQGVPAAPDVALVPAAPDAPAVEAEPDAAAAPAALDASPPPALDAAAAAMAAAEEPDDPRGDPRVRGPHRRDAGRPVRDAGRRPGRPAVPIF